MGVDFPGPVSRLLLRLVLPADRREEFEGDLIEEAETIVLPRDGLWAARGWLWSQIVVSAPPMLARRLEKEVRMYPQRWLVPAALLLIWGFWGLVDLGNNSNGGFAWERSSVVLSVDPDGPAAQAGLQEGDRILTMDGIPVEDLRALRSRPRTEIGETRVLVVERTDETSGVTTTENIEITYARMPAGDRTMDIVAGLLGLVFLLSGLVVFLKVQNTPSLLFAIVGFGFAGMLLPTPYIGSYGPRILVANVFFLAFLTAFASLLHLLLIFPTPKPVMERKDRWKLIYLPVVLYALLGMVNLLIDIPGVLSAPGAFALGAILIGYAVLSLAALVHSFLTAAPRERIEWGLNLLLGGVIVGLVPITAMMVAGLFVRTDLLPGLDFLFLTLILIPISFGVALLRGTRNTLPSTVG